MTPFSPLTLSSDFFGSEGRGFKSLNAHQFFHFHVALCLGLAFWKGYREQVS